MSAPPACLLLSQYVPATAQLFAEFRRLRDGLSPAEARELEESTEGVLEHATLMTVVRLCACLMLCLELAELRSQSLQRHKPCTCAMTMCRLYGSKVMLSCARQYPTSRKQTPWQHCTDLRPEMSVVGAGAGSQ